MSRARMSRERAARMAGRQGADSGGGLFADEEDKAIILAIMNGYGAAGASEDEILEIYRSLEATRIDASLLDLVLSGKLWIVGMGDDGPIYTRAETGGAR